MNERIEKTKEIHAKWEQVAVVKGAGEHERAEELGNALWIEERDLALSVELAGRTLEVSEHRRHAEELAREGEKVGEIIALSSEMQKQTEMRLAEWTEFKEKLKKLLRMLLMKLRLKRLRLSKLFKMPLPKPLRIWIPLKQPLIPLRLPRMPLGPSSVPLLRLM